MKCMLTFYICRNKIIENYSIKNVIMSNHIAFGQKVAWHMLTTSYKQKQLNSKYSNKKFIHIHERETITAKVGRYFSE